MDASLASASRLHGSLFRRGPSPSDAPHGTLKGVAVRAGFVGLTLLLVGELAGARGVFRRSERCQRCRAVPRLHANVAFVLDTSGAGAGPIHANLDEVAAGAFDYAGCDRQSIARASP